MAGEITVNNSDEFQEMVDNKDFRILGLKPDTKATPLVSNLTDEFS